MLCPNPSLHAVQGQNGRRGCVVCVCCLNSPQPWCHVDSPGLDSCASPTRCTRPTHPLIKRLTSLTAPCKSHLTSSVPNMFAVRMGYLVCGCRPMGMRPPAVSLSGPYPKSARRKSRSSCRSCQRTRRNVSGGLDRAAVACDCCCLELSKTHHEREPQASQW